MFARKEAESLVNIDGTVRDRKGLRLPVSLGLPYILAEVLQKPRQRAALHDVNVDGDAITETWEVNGGLFTVDRVERFVRAEQGLPIALTKAQDGKEVLVYQREPPQPDNRVTDLVYVSH